MKQQKQIIAFIILLAIAAVVWFWQSYTPSVGGKSQAFSFAQSYQPLNFPNPTIRFDKVDSRRKAEYKPEGPDITSSAGPQPPVVPVKIPKPGEPGYVPKPGEPGYVAPPLPPPELPANLKFFGYGNVPNNTARRAFLEDGDEVYIVNEGDTLLGRFRILKINNASIEFEEVGSGHRGQKMLEDQGPA